MKLKLLIALLLFSIGASAQTAWTNVGNGLQQRVVAGKTEYRFLKNSPYTPFGITDSLNMYLSLRGGNMTGDINYFYDQLNTGPNPNAGKGIFFKKNTDYGKVYFESSGTNNGSSNLIFENGDDYSVSTDSDLEGFVFRKWDALNNTATDIGILNGRNFRYKTFDVLHDGNVKTVNGQAIKGTGNISTAQDLSNYVTINGVQNITGQKTFTDLTKFTANPTTFGSSTDNILLTSSQISRNVGGSSYPLVFPTIPGTQTIAVVSQLDTKANLVGGNNFTGDQNITDGSLQLKRINKTAVSLGVTSALGTPNLFIGNISFNSFNQDGTGTGYSHLLSGDRNATIATNNTMPLTSGRLLNSVDAANYAKLDAGNTFNGNQIINNGGLTLPVGGISAGSYVLPNSANVNFPFFNVNQGSYPTVGGVNPYGGTFVISGRPTQASTAYASNRLYYNPATVVESKNYLPATDGTLINDANLNTAIGAQNLQAVTDRSNTSTNAIRVTGASKLTGAAALELAFDGNNGLIGAYNRNAGSYSPILVQASQTNFVVGNVGIGKSPTEKLDVQGRINIDGTNDMVYYTHTGGGNRYSTYVDGAAFRIRNATTSTFPLSIDNSGSVSIGATSGASKLTVSNGDIEVTTINSGIILAAPNGSRWRITVSNTGVLTTTAL